MRIIQRIKAAWAALTGNEQPPQPPQSPPAPTTSAPGCVIVRAFVFGKWRQVKLGDAVGFHVHAEAIDNANDPCLCLITAAEVAPEDAEAFRAYQRAKFTEAIRADNQIQNQPQNQT